MPKQVPKSAPRKWNTPLTQALDYIGRELVVMCTDTDGKPSRINFADCVIEDCTGQKGFASTVLASVNGGNAAIYRALRGPNSERLQRFFSIRLRESRLELVQMLRSGAIIQADMKRDSNPTDQMIVVRTMNSRMRNEYEHAVIKIREICHVPTDDPATVVLASEFPALSKLTGINLSGDIGIGQFNSDIFDETTGLPGIDLDGGDRAYVMNSLDDLRNGRLPGLPGTRESVDRDEMTRRIGAFETYIGRELTEPEIADIISGGGVTTAGMAFKNFIRGFTAAPVSPNPTSMMDSESSAMSGLPDSELDVPPQPDPRVPDSFLDMTDSDVQLMVKIRDALSDLDEQRQKYTNIVEFSDFMKLHDIVVYFTSSTDPKTLITANVQLRATGQLAKLNVTALRNSTKAFQRRLATALDIPQDLIDTQVELIESDTLFSEFIEQTYGDYGIDMRRLVQVQTCAALYTLYMYKKYHVNYRVGYQLTKDSETGQYSADYSVYPKQDSDDYTALVSSVDEMKRSKITLVIDLYLQSDMDRMVPWLHSFDAVRIPDYLTSLDDPEMSTPRDEIGSEVFEKIKQSLVSGIALIIKSKIPNVDVESELINAPVDEYLSFDLLFKIHGPVTESQKTEIVKAIDMTQYSDKSMTMMMAPISSSIKVGATIEVDG